MIKTILMAAVALTLWGGSELGAGPVTRAEYEKVQESNQKEFRDISVTLAEIKNELGHLNQDLSELKELRRTMLDRTIDIMLAGGLAFSGTLAWRNKKNGKKPEN